jgi:hypothetical protein
MNCRHSITGFLMGAFLVLSFPALAQEAPPPSNRFAIRVNLLGLASFNPIAEVEYRPSSRLGIFIGGGSPEPILEVGWIEWFTPHWYHQMMGGVYAGANIASPIGPLKHLSIKPIISYVCYPKFDTAYWPIDVPYPTRWSRTAFGTYFNVAYTQPLGIHFFIEPVIGLGASYTLFRGDQGGLEFKSLQVPVQLNVGFRF